MLNFIRTLSAPDTGVQVTLSATGEPDSIVERVPDEPVNESEKVEEDESPKIEFGQVPEPEPPKPQAPTPDLNTLMAQFGALQARLDGAKQNESQLQPVLAQIADLAQSIRDTQGKTQAAPVEDYATFMKKLEEKQYESPLSTSQAYFEYMFKTVIAPMFNELQGTVSKTAAVTAKQAASNDPTNAYILKTYGTEVESIASKLPPGPDLYQRACAQVGMLHLGEIVDARVRETQVQAKPVPPAKNASPGVVSVPQAPSGSKTVVIPKEYEHLRSKMDDAQIYQFLKESGILK